MSACLEGGKPRPYRRNRTAHGRRALGLWRRANSFASFAVVRRTPPPQTLRTKTHPPHPARGGTAVPIFRPFGYSLGDLAPLPGCPAEVDPPLRRMSVTFRPCQGVCPML